MTAHHRRVVDRVLSWVTEQRPVVVVMPIGWQFDDLLVAFGRGHHTRVARSSDGLPSGDEIAVLDGRGTPPVILVRLIEQAIRSARPLVTITQHAGVRWPDQVRVLEPPDTGVQVGDLDLDLGEGARDIAALAIEAGAGHPALVAAVLAELPGEPDLAESLATHPEQIPALRADVEEAWSLLSPAEHRLARWVTTVPGLGKREAAAVLEGVDEDWARLRGSGLAVADGGSLRMSTLARAVLDGRLRLNAADVDGPQVRALASALASAGRDHQLLDLLVAAPDEVLLIRCLRTLWTTARFGDVACSTHRKVLLRCIDSALRSCEAGERPWLLEARGRVLFLEGSFTAAAHDFAAARPGHQDPHALDLLTARTEYYRGDYERVREAAERVLRDACVGSPSARVAEAQAWLGQVLFNSGDLDAATQHTEVAEHILRGDTTGRGDASTAWAYLHLVRSLVAFARGQRSINAREQNLALGYASSANDDDVVAMRLSSNQVSAAVETGHFAHAVELARAVLARAEAASLQAFTSAVLHTLGEALRHQGDLAGAVNAFEESRRLALATGANDLAFTVVDLALCRIYRGDTVRARADLEEALTLPAVQSRYQRDWVVAALMLLDLTEGLPESAWGRSQELKDSQSERWRTLAAALGSIAAALMGQSDGGARALSATEEAIRSQDHSGWALCTIAAALLRTPADATTAVEALDALHRRGFVLEAALWRVAIDPLVDDQRHRLRAEAARAFLATRGVQNLLDLSGLRPTGESPAEEPVRQPTAPTALAPGAPIPTRTPVVRVALLGRFTVERDGRVLRPAAFGSRKGRHLLQLLAARHGGSMSRDQLTGLLWNDGGNPQRLRVLVSELRFALDPEKSNPSETFVGADTRSVWLVPEHVEVDSAAFLTAAAEGRRALTKGRVDAGQAAYERAASLYRGDVAAEVDTPLMSEFSEALRVTAGDVHRHLARIARDERRYATAVTWWLRVLDLDAYDEAAHLGLVRTLLRQGRTGEAQRAYRRYHERMAELGVRPAEFPTAS